MAVRIRLTRVGATKRPAYRVIAIDKRRSRDGRALEILGYYDPLTEPATVQLDTDKINTWIGKGAQPSDTVVKLMAQAQRAATAGSEPEKPKRAGRSGTKPSKKATAKAAQPATETSAPDVEVEAPAVEAPAVEAVADEAVADEQPETSASDEPAEAAPTDASDEKAEA